MGRCAGPREVVTPDAGDLVWLDFDPQTGHEQRGRRPALVLTPARYNERSGLMVACPITSKAKGYPFEVAVDSDSEIEGVVLSDQVKSVDWRARNAAVAGRMASGSLDEVREKLAALLML